MLHVAHRRSLPTPLKYGKLTLRDRLEDRSEATKYEEDDEDEGRPSWDSHAQFLLACLGNTQTKVIARNIHRGGPHSTNHGRP